MIQLWASDGTPMLSLGDRLYKFFGNATVGWNTTGAAQSGTITDARFTQYQGCEPFAFLISGGFDPRGGGVQFVFSGNTLTWTYPYATGTQSSRPNVTFSYGIF